MLYCNSKIAGLNFPSFTFNVQLLYATDTGTGRNLRLPCTLAVGWVLHQKRCFGTCSTFRSETKVELNLTDPLNRTILCYFCHEDGASVSCRNGYTHPPQYKVSDSMELSPSWEAASCVTTQEIPNILWNTVFTRAFHWSLSWTRSIQSIRPHSISLRSTLILSTHLRLSSYWSFSFCLAH
jgi:hypothetical protein